MYLHLNGRCQNHKTIYEIGAVFVLKNCLILCWIRQPEIKRTANANNKMYACERIQHSFPEFSRIFGKKLM